MLSAEYYTKSRDNGRQGLTGTTGVPPVDTEATPSTPATGKMPVVPVVPPVPIAVRGTSTAPSRPSDVRPAPSDRGTSAAPQSDLVRQLAKLGADALGLFLVAVHNGILKQGIKSLDRLNRIVSLRHRHRLYSTNGVRPS